MLRISVCLMTIIAAAASMSDGCQSLTQEAGGDCKSAIKADTVLTVGLLQSKVLLTGFVPDSFPRR